MIVKKKILIIIVFSKHYVYFTEDNSIAYINNMNDATKNLSNYNSVWTKIIDLLRVNITYGENHKDGLSTLKVVEGCNQNIFKDQRKKKMNMIDDIFIPVQDEVCSDEYSNDCDFF